MNLQKLCRRVLPVLSLATVLDFSLLLAQNDQIRFERIGIEQGLSQSTVLCILQDRQGFMWFGTQDGLNKYDGYDFTVYRHDVLDSTSLSDPVVTSICEDRDGTLWIGTYGGGLNRFEREKGQFTRFVNDPKNPHSLGGNVVRSIYEDRSGTLWIGTSGGGLNRFERGEGQFTRFVNDPNDPHSLSGNLVYAIHEDSNETLWIGTNRGLNRFESDKRQFSHFFHDRDNPHSLSSSGIMSIYEDRAGTLWIGTFNGHLNKFDREKGQFIRFVNDPNNPRSLKGMYLWSIYEDRAGTFWIGTQEGGLHQFDRVKEQFTHFVNEPNNPHSLSSSAIMAIYEDRAGTLWIGTYGGALNRFDREKERFFHYANEPRNPHSLSNNHVWTIYEDRAGTLWIGTHEGGLNKFDREKEQFTHFSKDPKNPHSLSNNWVKSIYEDRTGTLWIGTVGGGLNKFDREKEQFGYYANEPKNPHSLSHDFVYAICEDRAGTLWIGTAYGLNKLDRETGQFTRFFKDPKDPRSLSDNGVSTIYEDHTGTLWIGTEGGLNKLDRDKGRFTRFVSDSNNSRSLSSNAVMSIYEDCAGTLWIGTSGGLNKFDPETEQFTCYTVKNGLPNNQVVGILEDNSGRLWLSTIQGVSRFDPQTKTFRNYDITDGLQSNEFNPAYYKNKRGEMLFGGINGFNIFHPDSMKDNSYIPPLAITAFRRYNTQEHAGLPIEDRGISAKTAINLTHKDDFLWFEFAALNFRQPEKNQHAYKLEGYSDSWMRLGTKRDVTFTNLDPGEYTLRVKGSNNDGVWNEEGVSLKITISPPWWDTKWAYALYFLLLAGIIYSLRRHELNRLHLKNQLQIEHVKAEKMKELDHLKSRFFANISHEFRTPLTLILGPVEQMRSNAFKGNVHEAYDMILRNGKRLLRLINQLLDLARLEAGGVALQARAENIVSFVKGLVFSFASAAERKRIDLSVACEEESLIVYFDRDKLEKIVSNLVSNALKFTPEGGKVGVQLSVGSHQLSVTSDQFRRKSLNTDNWLLLTVKDTGPGIPPEQREKIFDRFYQVDASHTREHEGTGIGLALTKELVELHGGEISVESEVGRGAKFIVRLPLRVATGDQLSVISDQFARLEDRESRIEDRVSSIEDQASSNQHQATKDQQPETSNQILIIEDNRDVRAYIRQYLEPEFRIIEAADGIEGVALALETIPDLIICDVMMPKRDGYEVCRMLKTDEKTSHVPIIMLTAKADRESKVHGLETGADDYLIKPFDAAELLARVHNLIKLRQQLRERFGREITLQPKDLTLTSMDEQFLSRAMQIVEEHMSDEELSVEFLAHKIGMSRVHLNRKLRALTDQAANEFIRTLRLKRAAQLLAKKSATVLEIAYEVGFSNPSYFAECFEKQFGVLPSKFAEREKS